MRKTICTCDRCGKEITGGVVYTVTVYAEDIVKPMFGVSGEVIQLNIKQNTKLMDGQADLCRECKDAITDGIFIV